MKMTFRWYGESDPVSVRYISQIPTVTGVVSAVYDVPPGEVWSVESIKRVRSDAEKAGLEFSENKVTFWMKDNRGTHFVEAGLDCWIHGKTSMTGGYLHHQYEMDEMKIAACAYWKSENVLMMEWRYPEMAFFDHVSFEWKEDRVYMKRWVNMNSQALERPVVTAKICES